MEIPYTLSLLKEDAVFDIEYWIDSIHTQMPWLAFEDASRTLCDNFLTLAASSLLANLKRDMFFLNLCRSAENWRRHLVVNHQHYPDDDSTDIAFDDNMEIEILVDNNGFSLSAPLGYAHISVRIYSLTGVLLVDKVSSGKSFNMNWLENQITIPGIYIYKVSLDKKVYYGKFTIINN